MNPWATLAISSALSFLQREIYAFFPGMSRWLILYEVAKLPDDMRSRHKEEWLAESEEYRGSVRQVVQAASLVLCRSANRLARDHYSEILQELDSEIASSEAQLQVFTFQCMQLEHKLKVDIPICLLMLEGTTKQLVATLTLMARKAQEEGKVELAATLDQLGLSAMGFPRAIEKLLSTLLANIEFELECCKRSAAGLPSQFLVARNLHLKVSKTVAKRRVDWKLTAVGCRELRSLTAKFNQLPDLDSPERDARKAQTERLHATLINVAQGNPRLLKSLPSAQC